MNEPKKRKSKARSRMGRSPHALKPANCSACPQCGAGRVSHRACPECGHYRGRQVFEVAKESEV